MEEEPEEQEEEEEEEEGLLYFVEGTEPLRFRCLTRVFAAHTAASS